MHFPLAPATVRDARILQLEARLQHAQDDVASAEARRALVRSELAGERHSPEDFRDVCLRAIQASYSADWRQVAAELRAGLGALLGDTPALGAHDA